MHRRAALGCALVALAPAGAQGVRGEVTLQALHIEGGSADDQAFARAALGLQPGAKVHVELWHDGKKKSVTVKLGVRPGG